MGLLDELAQGLILPTKLVLGLARKASHAYKTYTIPKNSGGQRTIHHPSKELKAIQRWLLHNKISSWPVHPSAFAYRSGISIRDNASQHAGSSYLLRMDLLDFFPSITARDINRYLQARQEELGWDRADRTLFTKLVCMNGRLTIGAPSSPALSNAMCFELDEKLSVIAKEIDGTYTRYADDLFFSTYRRDKLASVPDRVAGILRLLSTPKGLRINKKKTRHYSKRGRRRVTGIVLGSDERVHLGRDRKRYIRRQLHRWAELSSDERAEVAGLLAFAISIEPDLLNALVLKYGRERVESARRNVLPG